MSAAEILDAAILVWLIGTWFYEGHHRRCTVVCGERTDQHCMANDDGDDHR